MSARVTPLLLLTFACLVQARLAAAQPLTFRIDGSASRSQFVSDAPLERITGVASGASGELRFDPDRLAEVSGTIKVPIASIKTGIDLRDEHLRSDSWLDAGKFPHAEFVITSVSGVPKLVPNEGTELTVAGRFSVHGVSRDLSTKARVRWTPPQAEGTRHELRVQASFVVHLKDHNVSIPSIVALKVSPDIRVNVDLRASAEASPKPQPIPAPVPPPIPEPPSPQAPTPAPEDAPAAASPLPTPKPKPKPRTAAPSATQMATVAVQKPPEAPQATPAASAPSPAAPAARPAVTANAPAATAPAAPQAAPVFDRAFALRKLRRLLAESGRAVTSDDLERVRALLTQSQQLLARIRRHDALPPP